MLNSKVTARSRENTGRSNPFGNDELLVQLYSCKTLPNSCSLPILFFISVNISKLSLTRALTVRSLGVCSWHLLIDLNVGEIHLEVGSECWILLE